TKLGISSPADLAAFLPVSYMDATAPLQPEEVSGGTLATFTGKVLDVRTIGTKVVMARVGGQRGTLNCVWFNQPWMKNKLIPGNRVVLYGRADSSRFGLTVVNPQEPVEGTITPVYRKIPEIGQKTLRELIRSVLDQMEEGDWMPEPIRDRYQLPGHLEALRAVHFPSDAAALSRGKRRLAFEELLLFQSAVAGTGDGRRAVEPLVIDREWTHTFLAAQPFRPTNAQLKAIQDIERDLGADMAMARMVQGDVGCGKTLIAFAAIFLCARAGGQAALMAPTEILASQHYENARSMFSRLDISCGLLTGTMTAAEHRRALEQIESGQWQVVIGTHALISERVRYRNLRLVVTDEQHCFGVRHRTMLSEKGMNPHVLVMSATPIPRTLSLILYGDLDLSVVDELPPGRMPVKTRIVPEEKTDQLWRYVEKAARAGHQCYVVCPLIGEDAEEEQSEQSAYRMYDKLSQRFSGLRVGLIHGRMGQAEKEEVLSGFYEGQVHVLVSTTVIEVGVNVPNATVMVIVGAERFGLAQLHQLRGRVGRGTEESWCFLLSEPNERLRLLCSTNDGFEVAQKDLEIRGPGEYFGTRQSGSPEMPALALTADPRLLEECREAFLTLSGQRELRSDYAAVLEVARQRYQGQSAARN
ncbi:MAG: ATP-dependent DNA helicase RecG, partial [Clostridia bacterium]|nr:ATP-dependent DNA helicase RecG [Clostridia bacterium]